jgi:hypothetical protein
MKILCPFYKVFKKKIDCPYLHETKFTKSLVCDDIDNCPGNGDAWCSLQIHKYFAMLTITDRFHKKKKG